MKITEQPKQEPENREYEACTFKLDDRHIIFRTGKVTPTRIGNFVAIYDRVDGIIVPVDTGSREIDFLVVDVSDRNKNNRGQFVFPKAVLLKKGIISQELSASERRQRTEGKLSFRVFPPWERAERAALKTQEWQCLFFFTIPRDKAPNLTMVRQLFVKT